MRLNKFTLAILFSVCSIYGFSQEQHPVKGKIENAKNEAVGMAAIQIYKADSKDCSNCPFKEKCTKSKYKQILRHVWEEYKEMVNDYRHHDDVKEIYKQRPQHIERVFADGKMKYGLRKTYFKTKERVHRELTLLYACMNLKKFALHHYI